MKWLCMDKGHQKIASLFYQNWFHGRVKPEVSYFSIKKGLCYLKQRLKKGYKLLIYGGK